MSDRRLGSVKTLRYRPKPSGCYLPYLIYLYQEVQENNFSCPPLNQQIYEFFEALIIRLTQDWGRIARIFSYTLQVDTFFFPEVIGLYFANKTSL